MSQDAVRCPSLLTLALLVALLLVGAPTITATTSALTGGSAQAAETEPVGPEPAPYDSEDNIAVELGGYEDPDTPFTWAVAWILTVSGVLGVVALGLFYRYRVGRDD